MNAPGTLAPTVDQVGFRSLYQKTWYTVETADGWSLVVTRYRPTPQTFPQPLWGEPMLLVHGFSQNRHAWTSGQFVKNLLFFGCDVHILELRGHGKSSRAFQRERSERTGRPLPADLDYGWDIDSYFLYDLPAAVAAVRRVAHRKRVFYCGHSMGGMLGYGYAGIHDDFDGLITIGSASELGRDFRFLRALAYVGPVLGRGLDAAFAAVNAERALSFAFRRGRKGSERPPPLKFNYVPVDKGLKLLERQLARAEASQAYRAWTHWLNPLVNDERAASADIRWLLREGGEREPRPVVAQFFKWVRRNELVCYRTGYDFRRGFSKITVPMAIFFGDRDPLASVESTRSVYRGAKSDYLLWRPVKGNSHIELTMGHDIRQICFDIKNLIEYARTHRPRASA